MLKYNYYFLHGFLGTPQIFSSAINSISSWESTGVCLAPSLLSTQSIAELTPRHDFQKWAQNFNHWVLSQSVDNKSKNILVGYSQGGRLGIHAYFQNQDLWENCIFLSSNPGLINPAEVSARKKWEQMWTESLVNDPWPVWLKKWNQQSVFKNSLGINPSLNLFCRQMLKMALSEWSLTRHTIDLHRLNDKKLHWLVGNKDKKYQKIFSQLKKQFSLQNIQILPGDHRLYRSAFEKYIEKLLVKKKTID